LFGPSSTGGKITARHGVAGCWRSAGKCGGAVSAADKNKIILHYRRRWEIDIIARDGDTLVL
jgi:hypothetical protein